MAENNLKIAPIVREATRAQGENVQSIIIRLNNDRIVIPDYQRDAEQWDLRKESLFIESLLNNLTTPSLFFWENLDTGTIEVVDGQQRLSTILKYANDELRLMASGAINYFSPESVHYSGKKFSEIPKTLQNVFNDYPLAIIYLPASLQLSTKLEIFRRINEGGTPLTAQDIRLSYYSESRCVYFIRLAGIYAETDSANRMIEAAAEKNVENPWGQYPDAWELWKDWWDGKDRAKGQTPSAMVLWYLAFLHREKLNQLICSPSSMKHLPLVFHGSTEEALDIYCAQLQFTDTQGGTPVFPTYGDGLEGEFHNFVEWLDAILRRGLPGISVDKYKQMALLIGAAVELKIDPDQLSHDAWDAIANFIETPRQAGEKWLEKEGGYPESRGRWKGERGQKAQCDMARILLSRIVKEYP
ncbi:DUF262 domain-containing protein [Candidatus Poribacteria bacterium]|nr:MAG: DUF262 domain-containing protein [Candidatus Poribacteria bacterium]